MLWNCNNERVLQLPEIESAEVTEVLDVSPAYIFYDETQPDSTLFNRKNLIGTTNWLVNVDKRLTLKQAIPHIQYLQEKRKKASMHKNENAKNYFTCNATSIENLGFIEFTDVNYVNKSYTDYSSLLSTIKYYKSIEIKLKNINEIYIHVSIEELFTKKTNIKFLKKELEEILQNKEASESEILLTLDLRKELNFQDYISTKREVLKIKSDRLIINSKEFIY